MLTRLSTESVTSPTVLKMPYRQKSISTFKSCQSVWFFTFYAIIICSLVVFQLTAAAPIFTEVQPEGSTQSPSPVPDQSIVPNFRSQIENDGNTKVYIDRLSAEEVAYHRKTGNLPKRTMQLIEKVLKAQVPLEHSDTTSSSVGAIDLLEELFKKTQ